MLISWYVACQNICSLAFTSFIQRTQDIEADVQMRTFLRALKSVPASGEVWARYMRFLVCCSQYSLSVRWSYCLTFQERSVSPEEAELHITGSSTSLCSMYYVSNVIAEAYNKMEAIAPLQANVEQLVPVILARAGYEKRRLEAVDDGESIPSLGGLSVTSPLIYSGSWI